MLMPYHPYQIRSRQPLPGLGWRLAAGMLVALLLAGCASGPVYEARQSSGSPTEDYPIRAATRSVTLTVPVATDGTLTAEDRARVVAFFEQWRDKGAPAHEVRLSVQGVNPAIVPLALARIRALAQPRGLALIAEAPATEAPPGITLRGRRMVAVAPECPAESAATNDFNNRTSPALGCSLQRSLAAMIDNPNDLLVARGTSPADGPRLARVIDQYRQGQPTAANTESTGNASIVKSVGGKN